MIMHIKVPCSSVLDPWNFYMHYRVNELKIFTLSCLDSSKICAYINVSLISLCPRISFKVVKSLFKF